MVEVSNRRIHMMADTRDSGYRDIRIIVPPYQLAPHCKPTVFLDCEDLFSVSLRLSPERGFRVGQGFIRLRFGLEI